MKKNDENNLNNNDLSFNTPFISNSRKSNIQILNNNKKNSFSTNTHSSNINNNTIKKSLPIFNNSKNVSKIAIKKTKTQTQKRLGNLKDILSNPNNNKYHVNFFITRAQSMNANKMKLYKKYIKPKKTLIGNDNPLFIPKEDLIFEEMKNYRCFQEEAKKSMDRIGIPFIYINMRLNKNYDVKNNKMIYNKKCKNDNENGDDKHFKKKRIYKSLNLVHSKQNQKKFQKLYNTAPNFNKAMDFAKSTKKIIDLNEYQDVLLQITKPEVSEKLYKSMQNNLSSLKELAESKYENNFSYIKTLENDEKVIIKNINKNSRKFYNNFMQAKRDKIFVKNSGPKFDLPYIKFESVANTEMNDKSMEKSRKSKRKKVVKKLKEFHIKLDKNGNHYNENN